MDVAYAPFGDELDHLKMYGHSPLMQLMPLSGTVTYRNLSSAQT